MPKVEANGIEIYHEVHGAGAPLVYIGGAVSDLRRSSMAANPLVEHFRVLSFDQRGQGQTDKPDVPYTTAMFADDAACLMDAAGFSPAMVMGVSFGGMVAQELALRYPEKVAFLVLCCSGSGGAGGSSADFRAILDDPGRGEDENVRAYLALQDRRRTPEYMASHPEEIHRLVEQYKRGQQEFPSDPVGSARLYGARQSHNTYDRLGQIKAPTLVLGGKYDGQAPPENQESLASSIPDAEIFMFEGGHQFLGQDGDAAYGTIINRLRGFLSQPMFGSGIAGL